MTAVDDPELLLLLRALQTEDAAPPTVPSAPASGESTTAWLATVADARARADRSAVRQRGRVDAASRALFGTMLSDILPDAGEPLVRSEMTVSVPPAAQLADLVPALRGVAPLGPAAPVVSAVTDSVRVAITAVPHPESVIVRLHGGAFWMGGGAVPDHIDRVLVERVAREARAAVFDVDYRLAPEHPYPAAIVDVLAVLDAVRAAMPTARLAVLGTSSGANTAVLAARADAMRRPDRRISALALIVPSVLLSDGPPALRDDPVAWRQRLQQLRSYLGDDIDAADPWVSPGAAACIDELPPTFMAVARYDDVAWGAVELRRAVLAGGGSAELRTYPMTHVTATPQVEAAVVTDAAAFLRHRLRADSGPAGQYQPVDSEWPHAPHASP